MSTPDRKNFRTLHSPQTGHEGEVYREPIILFSLPEARERWNSMSVAEQYADKALTKTFAAVTAGCVMTMALVMSGAGKNEWWPLVPLVVGETVGFYYWDKFVNAGGRIF